MKTPIAAALFVILLVLYLAVQFNHPAEKEAQAVVVTESREVVYRHFADTLLAIAVHTPGYDTLGLGGGSDAFLLRKIFPRLSPTDFEGVTAIMGDYSVQKGELYFTGNSASNSAVLDQKGYGILLERVLRRMQKAARNRRELDELILLLR